MRVAHGIGCVFYHLCRRDVGEYYGVAVEYKWFIEPLHHLPRTRGSNPYDNSIGAHEIFNSHSLGEKLRIGRHVETDVEAALFEFLRYCLPDLRARTDRNGTFGNENRIVVDITAHLARHFEHISQIGAAVLIWRRTYGAEYDFVIVNMLRKACGEVEPACFEILDYHLLKPGLVNGNDPIVQPLYLLAVNIDACNIDAHIGKTGPRNEAHITCTYNCDLHKWKINRI